MKQQAELERQRRKMMEEQQKRELEEQKLIMQRKVVEVMCLSTFSCTCASVLASVFLTSLHCSFGFLLRYTEALGFTFWEVMRHESGNA